MNAIDFYIFWSFFGAVIPPRFQAMWTLFLLHLVSFLWYQPAPCLQQLYPSFFSPALSHPLHYSSPPPPAPVPSVYPLRHYPPPLPSPPSSNLPMRYSRDQLLEIQPSTPNFELVNRLRELRLGVGLPRKRGCRGGRKKLRSIQVVPSRNLHPLMVPPFLQPHPDLQSAVGKAPLSSKHPTHLPTTDCLLSITPLMGGQPSDAPALSPPSPLQQGGQSSNAPALSPPSPLPQGSQPIALALSPSSPLPQDGQPSDAPGLSPSSSTLLLCPSDSTLSICHLNSQSAVKTEKERNYYSNLAKVNTLAGVEAYRKEFPSFSFQATPFTPVNLDSSFYRTGDPVYTVQASGTIGVLGLPRSLTTTDCVDDNPAAYQTDTSHSCVRAIATTECRTGAPGLNANSFIQGFRVVTSPKLFQELNTSVPGTNNFYSLYNNSLTISVELDTTNTVSPVQCFRQPSGLTAPCGIPSTTPLPSPSLVGNTCQNVLKQVHYRVITDGTAGINRVLARVVLTNLAVPSTSPLRFTQSFSTAFEASSSSGSSGSFERSGNPGYVRGQPILAGVLNETSSGGDTKSYQIFLGSNRERYMTVVRASASGDCFTDSDSRMSVAFGHNVRTGCLLRVSASNLTQYCALMQQKIVDTMEFDSIPELTPNGYRDTNRYVGLYGNSDVSKTGDWVKVLYQNPLLPTTPPSSTSSCQLTLALHIQILYANIGALVNPQAKIIALSYLYDSPKAVQIRPTLTGEYSQPVEITTSVAFIDVSEPAVKAKGEAPIFLAKLPYDFFYPFISGASAPKPLLFVAFLPLVLVLWGTL
ncbi:hypothetical protein ACOMHN_027672 [Nucella lapillus]